MATQICTRPTATSCLHYTTSTATRASTAPLSTHNRHNNNQPKHSYKPFRITPSSTHRRAIFTTAFNRQATLQQKEDAAVPEHILTWNRFFDLRRKRRFLNLGASCLTSLTTIGVSAPIIATSDIDKVFASIVGVPVDPFIPLGVTALAVGAVGWMVGPSIGNAGFNFWAQRKGWKAGIGEKEKSFFDRIKRYRADPAGSSIQNPVPDYYGEKIKSVSDYRRWLKDQRVFARKVSKNML